MKFTAGQIAELIEGVVDGDPNATVHKLSKIEEGEPSSLSFLANPKYTPHIYDTEATIVIVNKDFSPEKPLKEGCTLLRVDDAYAAFARLLDVYDQITRDKKGISKFASVDENAKIGDDVYLGDFVSVASGVEIESGCKIYAGSIIGENVKIGKSTTIYHGVKLYAETRIGNECMIHSGVVIGSDGFGFSPNSENNYKKVAQIGNVIIEDHVEIGANTTIDRATLGSTIIRKGVKLDNLIQIAHNVEVGENTVMAAQCGIAGSTKIGKDCMFGGQVGIAGHLEIANGVKIAAQSGIGNSIKEEGAIVQGSPAYGIGEYKRSYIGFRKLPELMQRIDQLEKELKEFKSKQ